MMIRFLLVLSLSIASAFAENSALLSDFSEGISRFKVGTLNTQAFCYQNAEGPQGYQIDRMQRIASITKVLTTYFASEKLDLKKRYSLKLHITSDSLHIEGGRDPYFEEEKMFLLMKALNDLGYKSFKTVTMDDNFIFSDEALSQHREITPSYSRARLAYFLKRTNRNSLLTKWNSVKTFAAEEGVDLSKLPMPSLTATNVFRSALPISAENAVVYVHRSLPFHRILKSMNVQSKNIVAHNVFLEAGAVQTFSSFMVERGFSSSDFVIYNGSGLPMINGNNRRDNLSTCRLLLKLMPLLEKSLEKHNLILSDILAVNGGKDLGSFRNRFKPYPETHFSVLSKTGTLMQTSTLAGVMLINGSVPFAILNNTTNSTGARSFQDYFVSRMFHHLGNASPIPYMKISIFPADSASNFLSLSNLY